MTTFKTAAKIMDLAQPPDGVLSLRTLMKVHRWLREPDVISLREILSRHREPEGAVKLLVYNTKMIQGVHIKDISTEDILKLINHLGLDFVKIFDGAHVVISDILKFAQIDPKDLVSFALGANWQQALAESLGVSDEIGGYMDDCLNVTTGGAWGMITEWTEVSLDMILDLADKSLELALNTAGVGAEQVSGILKKAGVDPLSVLIRYLSLGFPLGCVGLVPMILAIGNATGVIDFDPIGGIGKGGAPERPERAAELGQVLREPIELGPGVGISLPYGIIALTEQFLDDTKDIIKDKLAGCNCQFISGPAESSDKTSSGLFQIIRDLSVRQSIQMTFVNCGDPWIDMDYWANKGVLLTYIDVGVGTIELYSTHLLAGGDFPTTDVFEALKPTTKEKCVNKKMQSQELAAFFEKNHDPHNVAIIVGDMNLSGDSVEVNEKTGEVTTPELDIMMALAASTNTEDAWTSQWQDRRPSEKVNGPTSNAPDENLSLICTLDDARRYCVDPNENTTRVDWILVEKPGPVHTFDLDLSRVRRRSFPRDKGGFISDHVGLDTTLIVNARNVT